MFRVVCLTTILLAVGGCASGGRRASDSPEPTAKATAAPTTEQVQSAAPGLAESLENWRVGGRSNERLVVRGPTFVGLDGVTAKEAATMGRSLADAINQRSDARLRFVPANAGPDEVAGADSVLDARASWEPGAKRGSERRPRLLLEVVDPRNGQTVFSADSPVAFAATPELPAQPSSPPVVVAAPAAPAAERSAEPVARVGLSPDASAAAGTPAASAEESERYGQPAPTPPTASDSRRESSRRDGRPDHTARRSSPASVRVPPSIAQRDRSERSPVVSLTHGVVYFEDSGLADRVIILQERTAVAEGGELSVRFVLTSRKGKKKLEIRCEFYDEQGASAGGVGAVELPIRAGSPATVALASRKPAAHYIVFIKD